MSNLKNLKNNETNIFDLLPQTINNNLDINNINKNLGNSGIELNEILNSEMNFSNIEHLNIPNIHKKNLDDLIKKFINKNKIKI